MSAESQPDPILPNYNPSSWDVPTLSPEERAILDTEYITFPIAQNQNITFPVAPTAPTLADGTNTTQVATTGFVQNAITAFKSASNVWSGLQTFSAGLGITAATISAISGTFTLTGGTTVSNATFSGTTTLSNPFTPAYSYPIETGKIGEVVSAGPGPSITFTPDAPEELLSMTGFTPGIWVMTATIQRNSTPVNVYCSIAISTITDDVSSANALGIEFATGAGFGLSSSLSCIVNVTSASTVYYFNAQTGLGGATTMNATLMRAIRVA